LEKLKLDTEGVRVLGVRHLNGKYIGAPKGETELKEGDVVILYSKIETHIHWKAAKKVVQEIWNTPMQLVNKKKGNKNRNKKTKVKFSFIIIGYSGHLPFNFYSCEIKGMYPF